MQKTADVVIVGAGIGGGALAARLAREGLGVVVLERDVEFRDIVRGEAMVPWGYLEAVELGLADTLMSTPGASVMTRMVPYDELMSIEQAQRMAQDLTTSVDGAPGIIGVGHPELRESLAGAATAAGATVVRGVTNVKVAVGEDPVVEYRQDGADHALRCRLVVGADGKGSTVRRAFGVGLSTTTARVMLSGLLVDDGGVWDRTVTSIVVDGSHQFIVLPRADQRIRLYVGRRVGDGAARPGPDAAQELLAAYDTPTLPDHEKLSRSEPLGPCATFPMDDAWVDNPVVPGGVLIGDAAGWSNPVTAQGLSIAMRDARVLSEALLTEHTWTTASLTGYAEERTERMRRLRYTTALSDLLSGFGMPDRATKRARVMDRLRRNPELAQAMRTVHAGAWAVPAEAFAPDRMTSLALA